MDGIFEKGSLTRKERVKRSSSSHYQEDTTRADPVAPLYKCRLQRISSVQGKFSQHLFLRKPTII